MRNPTLKTIWSRRVIRTFTDEPVARTDLETIVEAARWAPSASNRRLQKFVVVQSENKIRQIKALSPGIVANPTALIVICTDWQKAQKGGYVIGDCVDSIDVGTAAENMLLATHSLGLGAGPVTSFSKAGLQVLLDLPDWLSPELIICLGHPAKDGRKGRVKPAKVLHWQELTYWEKYDSTAGQRLG